MPGRGKIEDVKGVMVRLGIGKKSHRRLSLEMLRGEFTEQWLLQALVSTGATPLTLTH